MIQFISHQPIDFTYNLNTCEALSENCLHYQTSDTAMFQFKNTLDGCWFFIGIRPFGSTSTPTEINSDNYTISGTFVTVSVDFTALGLTDGCYEIAIYEVCADAANNKVTNGAFATNLSGWTVANALALDVDSHTDTSVTLVATGGTAPLTYNIDGGVYQASTTFSGLTFDVEYIFCVKDANNIKTCIPFTIIECGTVGCSESDLWPHDEATLLSCDENDFFCRTAVLLGFSSLSITADNSSNTITMSWSNNSGTANALAGDAVYLTWNNQTQDYWNTVNTGAVRSNITAVVSDTTMNTGDVIHLYARLKNGTLVSNPEHIYTIVVA